MAIPYAMNRMGSGGMPFETLAYIESTGEQYIDSGVTFNVLNVKKFGGIVSRSIYFSLGTILSKFNKYLPGIAYNAGKLELGTGSDYFRVEDSLSTKSVTRVEYDFDIGKCFVRNDNLSLDTWFEFAFTNTNTIQFVVCCEQPPTYSYRGKCRIHRAWMERTDGVKVDFFPALCPAGKSYVDGNTGATVTATTDKPGLYDKVSKRFFVNQGTQEFLYE